jgi:hypothetical protein
LKAKGEAKKREQHWQGYTGVLPTFVENVAQEVNLNVTLRGHFASAQSKATFPGSSFTACVFDVAVGKVDMCVGNFWVCTCHSMGAVPYLPCIYTCGMYDAGLRERCAQNMPQCYAQPVVLQRGRGLFLTQFVHIPGWIL